MILLTPGPRIRRLSLLLAEEGLDRQALLRLGRRAARADAALDERARAIAAEIKAQREPGRFRANISALANEPEELLLRFLADELKLIRGDKPLRLERLEALVLGLGRALRSGIAYKATLGRCGATPAKAIIFLSSCGKAQGAAGREPTRNRGSRVLTIL